MYECFHCGSQSVIWDCDYDYADYGLEGKGIIHTCHCMNCGLTQREVAEKAGLTEVSISRYLSGARMPTVYSLMRIWKAIGRVNDEGIK